MTETPVAPAPQLPAPAKTVELEGKLPGDVIEVPIDCNKLFSPRDESLVVTDRNQAYADPWNGAYYNGATTTRKSGIDWQRSFGPPSFYGRPNKRV